MTDVTVRPVRMWQILAVLGCLVLLVASPAYAHTSLVSSSPRDGARLAEAPRTVSLRFSDALRDPAYVVVTAPGGARVERGPAEVDGASVTQRLAPLDARGRYTVAYRVVSADGHPVTGELSFTVAAATPTGPATAGTRSEPDAAGTPAPSAGADEHDHPSGIAAHWQHLLPVVGVLGAWLVVAWNSRRRRRA